MVAREVARVHAHNAQCHTLRALQIAGLVRLRGKTHVRDRIGVHHAGGSGQDTASTGPVRERRAQPGAECVLFDSVATVRTRQTRGTHGSCGGEVMDSQSHVSVDVAANSTPR